MHVTTCGFWALIFGMSSLLMRFVISIDPDPRVEIDQVCERLLQNETTARIPIVMMSGHVSEMTAAARKYPNIVATIAKPFMSDALVTLVSETLAKGPYVAETFPVHVEDSYVIVEV